MSDIFIDFSCKPNCWNYEVVYTCYGCKCCDKDKETRYKARIAHCNHMIEEENGFKDFHDCPSTKLIQQEIIRKNIKYFKNKISYYEKRLKEVEAKCLTR